MDDDEGEGECVKLAAADNDEAIAERDDSEESTEADEAAAAEAAEREATTESARVVSAIKITCKKEGWAGGQSQKRLGDPRSKGVGREIGEGREREKENQKLIRGTHELQKR